MYSLFLEFNLLNDPYILLEFYKQAHQKFARYDKDVSGFDECELTSEFMNTIKVTYVTEIIIKIGCRFVEEHTIKSNHIIFIVEEII